MIPSLQENQDHSVLTLVIPGSEASQAPKNFLQSEGHDFPGGNLVLKEADCSFLQSPAANQLFHLVFNQSNSSLQCCSIESQYRPELAWKFKELSMVIISICRQSLPCSGISLCFKTLVCYIPYRHISDCILIL